MRMKSISVDDEVFAELQRRAEPLVDDANSVLRRVFELEPIGAEAELPRSGGGIEGNRVPRAPRVASRSSVGGTGPRRRPSTKQADNRGARPPKGSLLPEADYVLPLLESLVELGGSAPTSTVVRRIGEKLVDKLTDYDRAIIKSGDVRWKNRVQFVRLGLIREGLISKESPRGIWEITDAGRNRVRELGAGNVDE